MKQDGKVCKACELRSREIKLISRLFFIYLDFKLRLLRTIGKTLIVRKQTYVGFCCLHKVYFNGPCHVNVTFEIF